MSFIQQPPQLGNQYADDRMLRALLRRAVPRDILAVHEKTLAELGERVAHEWWPQQLDAWADEPELVHFDPYGNRIDHVRLTRFWQQAPAIAAGYGLVATGYDAGLGEHARTLQFARVYLFHASSEFYTCPLAMTDGAARCLIDSGNARLRERAVPRFLSRDPALFWTSGQWMTETSGGSDVGGTETTAKQDGQGRWRLSGRKWFTSAVVADAALTLARPDGNGAGADNLALFYVEPRKSDGRFRNIEVDRLKPKLGTKKLPTAEIRLSGTPAEIVGETKRGVRMITPMLNITRIWTAIGAIALFRRGIALARDYATRRVAFGMPLIDQPLHAETLASLQAELEAMFELTFHAVELLGRVETRRADADGEHLLRLLTPIVKLSASKVAVAGLSEICECFGGAGYIEDTGIPGLVRDAQVLPIWEGTTNVLSLDVVRVLGQIGGLAPWLSALRTLTARATRPELEPAVRLVRDTATRCGEWLAQYSKTMDELQGGARGLALTLGRTLALALLVRQAAHALATDGDPRPLAAVRRFARHGIDLLRQPGNGEARMLASDVFT